MNNEIQRLAFRFRRQQEFSTGYSPLYAHIFGVIAGWLESPSAIDDPVVAWLIEVGCKRRSLDVTLLLAAGLHRDILAGVPAVAELVRYFPSVGGSYTPDGPRFEGALRDSILARRSNLAPFVQSHTVQTNETGRGLCWLLPVLATGWESVHLVDLGASAGLNLVAEQRAYRLLNARTGDILADLGYGRPVQFVTRCQGDVDLLTRFKTENLPLIVSRKGCDIAPFPLTNRDDELTLTAFVWADQNQRVQRLREGIKACKQIEQSEAPVRLHRVDLPDELNLFLHQHIPAEPVAPVIIYNTWMTSYLHDKGQSMMHNIDQWAAGQERPVLWLQWEPARDGSEPAEFGWCAWTADVWQRGEHRQWRLGWAHPHGGQMEFGKGFADMGRSLSGSSPK